MVLLYVRLAENARGIFRFYNLFLVACVYIKTTPQDMADPPAASLPLSPAGGHKNAPFGVAKGGVWLSEKALTGFFGKGNVRAIFSEFCEIQRKLPCCFSPRMAGGPYTAQNKMYFFRRTCRRKKYQICVFGQSETPPLALPKGAFYRYCIFPRFTARYPSQRPGRAVPAGGRRWRRRSGSVCGTGAPRPRPRR